MEKFSTQAVHLQLEKKQDFIKTSVSFSSKATSTPASLSFETEIKFF